MAETRLEFENGKYVAIISDNGLTEWLRYGEPWPGGADLPHMKIVGIMLEEIAEERKRNQAEHQATDGTTRKSHYIRNARGEQAWDTGLRLGWAPDVAAFMVLRYLRRDKENEHSQQSAKWYQDRLEELANRRGAIRAFENRISLGVELTPEEKERLKS